MGAPIALASAAGVPVTYWEMTDRLSAPVFYPDGVGRPPKNLDELSAAALRAAPGASLVSVYTPRSGAALHVTVKAQGNRREISVHRETGEVLGSRDFSRSFIARAYDLHTRILLGNAGRPVIFAVAAALLTLTVTGLILWWPQGRFVPRALLFHLRKGRKLRDLHSLLGLYSLLPVLLAASTTLVLSWPGPAPDARPAGLALPVGPAFLGRAERIISVRHPDLVLRSVSNLNEAGHVRTVAQSRAGKLVQIAVDRSTGEPLMTDHAADQTVNGFARCLHTGEFLGAAGRLLFAVAGVAPLILWLTGLCWWIARQRRNQSTRTV